MSLKPVKKSDRGKSWMQPRRDSKRTIQPEYHLIITEGTKTEPLYFEALKERINARFPNRIHMDIVGKGKSAEFLFNEAVERVRNNPNGYSHVWLVYDTDDFPKDQIDNTAFRCKQISTAQTKYHALWSNQCIELWFLLHFSYLHSDIDRKAYAEKLTEHLLRIKKSVYQKNRKDIFEVLLPYVDIAIQNAHKLAEENEGKSPSQSKPGTQVYELLEALRMYF